MKATKSTIDILKATLRTDPNLTQEQRRRALLAISEPPKIMEPASPLLTQAEAARYLRCSRYTINRMVKGGQLSTVKFRGLRRYRQADLDAIIDSGYTQR